MDGYNEIKEIVKLLNERKRMKPTHRLHPCLVYLPFVPTWDYCLPSHDDYYCDRNCASMVVVVAAAVAHRDSDEQHVRIRIQTWLHMDSPMIHKARHHTV